MAKPSTGIHRQTRHGPSLPGVHGVAGIPAFTQRDVTECHWPPGERMNGLNEQEQEKKEVWHGFWQQVMPGLLEQPESEKVFSRRSA